MVWFSVVECLMVRWFLGCVCRQNVIVYKKREKKKECVERP